MDFKKPNLENLHILYPGKKGRGSLGKYLACLTADGFIGVLQYMILVDTFELLGIEFLQSLIDIPLIGWMFAGAPELTAQHLFAMLCAVLFVGVPIFAWIVVLEPSVLRIPKKTERIGRALSIGVFGLIILSDLIAVWFRATFNATGFMPKSGIEIALGIFYGLLAAALMVMATFFTATVHITRADKPSQE